MKPNNHPDAATLALHAGGDLGWFRRWRTARHLGSCAECRDTVAAYQDLRDELPELAGLPADLPWGRLAAEMRANIRLGLAAGECVAETPAARATPLFAGARAALALAGVMTLIVTGIVLERPTPSVVSARVPVVQPTDGGIERRSGDQAFALMHAGVAGSSVTYSVSAQGTMGASYVDPQTSLVTLTKVYVE